MKQTISLAKAVLLATVFLFCQPASGEEPESKRTFPSRLRRPVAAELSASGELLYVANRRSGSLSIVDLERGKTVDEIDLGKQLSHLATVPGEPPYMVATDEATHELLLLDVRDTEVSVRQRLTVGSYPVSVAVSRDGRRCVVASLWSRRLSFVDLPVGKDETARVTATLDLPFAPRCQLLVKDDARLIVADSFSGRLAIVDCESRELVAVREFPAHNIRGLGVSANGKMLLVSHQMLNELAHTVRNDVHWGLLMSNDLRWLRLDAVLDPKADLYKDSHMHPLGEAGRGSADPGGLAVTKDGTVVVTISGSDELAFAQEDDFSLLR